MSILRALCSMLVAVVVILAVSASAQAAFSVQAFGGSATNPDGTRNAQAGGHPDFTTKINFATKDSNGYILNDGDVKDVDVTLPPGLLGNPAGLPTCTQEQLAHNQDQWLDAALCPVDSQVGVVVADLVVGDLVEAGLYNVEAPVGSPALLGFNVLGTTVLLEPELRPSDYGLTVHARNTSQTIGARSITVTLWGVPALPVHDAQRHYYFNSGYPSGLQPKAFTTAPMDCSAGPFTTSMRARSWQEQDRWSAASFSSDFNGKPLAVEDCETVPFKPSFTATLDTTKPDAPVGMHVNLTFPQEGLTDPDGVATGPLKKASVTLPDGLSVNPASADGLSACADEQMKLGSNDPILCPLSSKLGTVEATTPLLKEHLTGGIYLRPQNSLDPESGEMFRIALVVGNEERGVLVKLPGSVRADKDTGRLVATFDNNPQLPIGTVDLQFKGGPRAPLATPPSCGTKAIDAELSSWSGKTVQRQSTPSIDCTPGLGGFSPSLLAGTQSPVAGAFSPFNLSISKPDGNTPLTGLRMELPQGLIAKIAGNVGTQVGTATAFAGPGPNPFALPGKVYLEGAYGDAPYSLKVVVPAVAGPFNLGTVTVRQKLYVDPKDAHVTVVSDPLPTIVGGVPVRLQRIDVKIDKAGFVINPTSCAPKSIGADLASVPGVTAALSVRFQVGECASLGYTPKLVMTMTGKGQTKDGSHPALSARLTPPAGDANSKKVTVTLPLSLALDPGNANGLCEPVDAARNKCPAKSIVGSAQAQSILPDPVKGPVYFVRGERLDARGQVRKTLPKLFIPLTANGVTVNVWGDSNAVDDRLVTTFDNLPDAPFSTFDLNIDGGEHGILVVSDTNTCAVTNVADAAYAGQNGKTYTSKVTMGTPCALGIVKSSHTSTALKLTVGGVGAGRLTGSGNGVAKSSLSITSTTTATLSLKLAKATRRALARGRDVKVKVKVAFTAKGQKKAKSATKTLVLHGARKR